VPILTLL